MTGFFVNGSCMPAVIGPELGLKRVLVEITTRVYPAHRRMLPADPVSAAGAKDGQWR
jgi:hypothetical protein